MINEELNNMAPVPEGGQMPVGPEMPTEPEMPIESDEEETPGDEPPMDEASMRSELDRGFADVENKNRALETQKFISRNKLKNFKMDLLKQLYALLEEAGVDPNDPESIKNFLTGLEEQDPDLAILFETVFNTLSPDAPVGMESGGAFEAPSEELPEEGSGVLPGAGLMEKNNNLQEQIMR